MVEGSHEKIQTIIMMNPDLPFLIDKQNISGLFFDFDGVLVDSVPLKLKAYQEIFNPFGEDAVKEITNYHLANGGIDRYKKIDYVLRKFSLPLFHVNSLARQFSDLVKEKVIQADPIQSMLNLVLELQNQFPIFIVSGTPEEELIDIVRARNWSSFFQEVKGSPDSKVHIVNFLIQKYNLKREKCLFIGDATTDFLAARECNIFFIGVPY